MSETLIGVILGALAVLVAYGLSFVLRWTVATVRAMQAASSEIAAATEKLHKEREQMIEGLTKIADAQMNELRRIEDAAQSITAAVNQAWPLSGGYETTEQYQSSADQEYQIGRLMQSGMTRDTATVHVQNPGLYDGLSL